MKKYMTLILAGIVIVLAATLIGVLTFMKNQPPQQRAFEPLVKIKPMEPNSALWGENFPNQWSTYQKTATNNTDTTYGGSSQFSWLERDPRQKVLFTGYPFNKDYTDYRGHMNALIDVHNTKGVVLSHNDETKTTHATCYSCKSSD